MAQTKQAELFRNPEALLKEGILLLISQAIKKCYGKKIILEAQNLVNPPMSEWGDMAFGCFPLAKELGFTPQSIADLLSKKITELITVPIKNSGHNPFAASIVSGVAVVGPYINFTLDEKGVARLVLDSVRKKGKYGHLVHDAKKIMAIDMSSPNIAKPFGIGHLRSTIIGNALANLYESQGFRSIRINHLGDWGTQFGKLIVGYERFGDPALLKSNPISHLLDIYVKVNSDPTLEQEARNAFKKLEQGDKKSLRLWKLFHTLSLKEFNNVYKLLNIKFDWISGESLYNNHLDQIVAELFRKKLLKKSEGAHVVDLHPYGYGVCLIQKSDGTTLYATRDIAAAIDRYKKYKFSTMLYEVGSEQSLHFQQVFKVLELMGYSWAKRCVHIQHGLYLGSDGKKFSTRKGKTIFMQDVLNEVITLAKKELSSRKKLGVDELSKRAKIIAIAALLYGDLKNHRANDVIFDVERFLSFDGDTGPYLLYTYARLRSIMRRAPASSKTGNKNYSWDAEKKLFLTLARYPNVLKDSVVENAPSLLAKYV